MANFNVINWQNWFLFVNQISASTVLEEEHENTREAEGSEGHDLPDEIADRSPDRDHRAHQREPEGLES